MNLMNIYLTIKVYFCHIKVHACFKKIISRKKHFLIITTCVYLVLSAGRSIFRFLLRNLLIFLHQSPDFRCFEVERSACYEPGKRNWSTWVIFYV